jgi:hypothetical protein
MSMKLKLFERKHERLATPSMFRKRMAVSFAMASLLVFVALFAGVAGYHWIGGFDWIDSILEASMILGGMGPVNQLPNSGAKLFASAYALFSGLVFIAVMSIVLSPLVHRMLHKFHLDRNQTAN